MIAWDDYEKYKISPTLHSDLRHADVVGHLESFAHKYPDAVRLKQLGTSVEGRSIALLSLGAGTKRVFAWSQMHGNEPTHTAALLDLIQFLLTSPENPTAGTILAGCDLHLLLMLNPDGAQRWTRRNAQDIDINRDALHVQSPEGRILRDAVLQLQPDFALNLHNHRPHTTVGTSQQPASFSLLVPPVDAAETDTKQVLVAKRLAGVIAEAISAYSPGPVSRYNADFMPRCFGEWVQQQGAAALTIEAGGWSTIDAEPLVQLHCYGLVSCLEAIATEGYGQTNPEVYERLPRTGEHDLFDKLLRGVLVLNGAGQAPFRADIGINFHQTMPTTNGGRIVDLGDLHVTSGKRLIDANELVCLPGRFAWLPELTPESLPNDAAYKSLLASGVTSVLGHCELSTKQLRELKSLQSDLEAPINLGFLGNVTDSSPESLSLLLEAISLGLVGVLAEGLPAEVKLYLSLLNLPVVSESSLPTVSDEELSLADCASQAQHCAQILSLKKHGAIRLGAAADLMLLSSSDDIGNTTRLALDDLHRVIVGGNVVFEAGTLTDSTPGVLLRSGVVPA